MVEKIKKDTKSRYFDSSDIEYVIQKIPLHQISLNPGERTRQESGGYKDHPKYKGIKITMSMYGQYHTITLRKKGNKYHLLGGFIRFCIAMELNWDNIEAKIYSNISDYDAILIEITENTNRIDFTSFEIIMAIGKAKNLWKSQYPHSGRGKYSRKYLKNQTITASHAVMPSRKRRKTSGFVSSNYKILGMAERTLYNRVRLYEAIRDNIFAEKSINLFKNEQITYQQLLNKLQKIENKKKIQKPLGKLSETSVEQKTPKNSGDYESSSSHKSISSFQGIEIPSPINNLNQEPIKECGKNSYTPSTIDTIKKMEELVKLAGKDKEIKKLLEEVKKGNLSIEDALEKARKIIKIKMDITNESVDIFNRQGSELTQKCEIKSIIPSNNKDKENISGIHQNYKDSKCGSCSLAHLFIIECYKCDAIVKCENCGIPAFTVLCEEDIKKGISSLRDPNLALCEKSPEYALTVKNQIANF